MRVDIIRYLFIFALTSLLALVSCKPTSMVSSVCTEDLSFTGSLNKVLDSLKKNSPNNEAICINSTGGKVSDALAVANILQAQDISITIVEKCISNCAEILLPAAKEVRFLNDPLVGFHGNIFSYQHYVQAEASQDRQFCNWAYADEATSLLKAKNMDPLFWKEQMSRLNPNVELKYYDKQCPKRIYNFENQMWFPTSKQLSDLWGLQFEGSVCADNFRRCSKRLDRGWLPGTKFVIGNKVYISKSR